MSVVWLVVFALATWAILWSWVQSQKRKDQEDDCWRSFAEGLGLSFDRWKQVIEGSYQGTPIRMALIHRFDADHAKDRFTEVC
jgi:hypothetical protein